MTTASLHIMDARLVAYGGALATALVDGAVVGGWSWTLDLDRTSRRRVRGALVALYLGQSAAGDLAWEWTSRPAGQRYAWPRAEHELTALRRAMVVTAVATVADRFAEPRVIGALERRGSLRPHRAYGIVAGALYAAATAPVWLGLARDRLSAHEAADDGG